MTIILTPRPPLNLLEVVRITADDTSGGVLVYEVPTYRIPAEGPRPQRDVGAAAILTNMIVANTSAGAAAVTVWVEDIDAAEFIVAQTLAVAQDGYIKIDLDRQILQSGEKLYVRMGTSQTAEVHLSFVLNQREEFTVIEPS
jgi:phenylpyruvate tautomerase PptA (4-oxalocrotonate tautomerase family)